MTLRPYHPSDLEQIVQLFHDTVHAVCIRDYTEEQLKAWAPGQIDREAWDASLSAYNTLVAVEGEQIVGFADMDEKGYLDRLYVHKDFQRRGIATALCDRLESECPATLFTLFRPFLADIGKKTLSLQQILLHFIPQR